MSGSSASHNGWFPGMSTLRSSSKKIVSALSELAGQAFSAKYVFYNKRDLEAIRFLSIEPDIRRGDKFGDRFLKYNAAISKVVEQAGRSRHLKKKRNPFRRTQTKAVRPNVQ